MFHRSERLFLRPPFTEDWQAILASIGDEGIVRNLANAPWPYGTADARSFVALPVKKKYPRCLITRASDGAVIGGIGIDEADEGTELGYWIARAHWGQGYATEAGRVMVDLARLLGHARLTAGHFRDNPASGRVLRKLGFQVTGTLSRRYSRGRGEEAICVDHALDLEAEPVALPQAA